MSAAEFKLRKLIDDATYFISNAQEDETYHEKAKECLTEAEHILLENTRESYIQLSAEAIVKLAEVSLLSGKRDDSAERILDIFFQRISQEDQFYCQALLACATIEERKIAKLEKKGDANLKQVKHAFSFVQRAIEICTKSENKAKYSFMIYNASIRTWHIIRSLMRPGWSKHIAEILEKISNLLEEADDSDLNWRCRYLSGLCKSLVDSEKKPEALKCLDKLVDLTKKKGDCNFQEVLFRTRIHMYRDNNAMLANIKKETETGEDVNAFKSLYVIQSINSEIIPAAQIEKELQLLMSTIAPMSISDDPAVQAQAAKLSPLLQDRIAECGRIAIKQNLIQYAEGACAVVARARQGSLRAKVWCEYIKAELLLRKPSAGIDSKTGMKLNTLQRQQEDLERRVESLRVLDRAMIANKRLLDPDVTIEGCILIWNTGLPLMKQSARGNIYKPFQAAAAALEQIESNDSLLRVCIHLELAKYEIEQDFLSKASLQLQKALKIDYSTVQKQLGFELKEEDNPEDFQRPYDKVLKFLLKKLSLKTNIYGGDPESVHEQIILDVENAKTTKNSKMRQMLLDKAVKALQDFEVPEFEPKPDQNLVEEEIVAAKRKFMLQQVRERKERVLICSEIANFAMEELLVQLSFTAASLGTAETWDAMKDADLVIAQSNCHIQLAKCYVEYLLEQDIEIGHKDLVTLDDDQDEREFTEQQKTTFIEWKQKFTFHIIKAVQLGQQAKQTWLVFNAAIEFWNNYLPILKKLDYYVHIHPSGTKAMIECFEAMNGAFVSGDFSQLEHNKVDYELEKKMNVFTNISMQLARIYEHRSENNDAVRICDILLTKQLPSHLRKTFDSIRAKVTKQVSKLGEAAAKASAPAKAPVKGAPPVEVKEVKGPSKTDILTSEVLSFLELIQNGQKEMIQKAVDHLNMWVPQENEEIELELNVELWCRLGRLAISQNTPAMFKVALYCADTSLKNGDTKIKLKQYMLIPVTRLRWYAVAQALYGEALYKLLDTQKQEKESQDRLLHASVARLVDSCHIASKAGIGYLVLESSKSMWNSMLGVLDAPNNRRLLVEPMCKMHTFLLAVQENSDPDFLNLFYTALFQVIAEQRDWKTGEKIVDEAFKYMPNTHHKVLWEAKMNFLSKLGKNVLSAISNMKESNASLMAKVWVRLARSSQIELEQHQAYNKAIEILRKEESIEVVEVLIEYAEWMQRNQYNIQDVEDQLMLAVDLLMDIEPQGWDDDEDEMGGVPGADDEAKTRKTGKTSSSRQSKALTKKSKAGGKSIKQSIAGKTTKTKVSKASMRSKSLRSQGTRQSKKTTTSLSKRQEEEANPQFLNCSHYDKLVRIHSMLAMLASDSQKQREYALDAHYFIMKMWEQSFVSLNATVFFEKHAAQIAELGYKVSDQASRRDYFSEVLTSSEFNIPMVFQMPEKPEDWTIYEMPAEIISKGDVHEDKVMIGKWTFVKPELTYLHLRKLADLLEGQLFSLQLIPVLILLEIFAGHVLGNTILEQTHALHRSRLLMNLGLKNEGMKLFEKIEAKRYILTDEERKVQYEKIKALNDSTEEKAQFQPENSMEPFVVESVRIHEAWTALSEELVKWGEFTRAKQLATEASLHSRILKDPDCYTTSTMVLSSIAYVEGASAQSLKLAMVSQQSVRDMQLLEKTVVHTFSILQQFNKWSDVNALLTPLEEMLRGLRRINNDKKTNKSKEDAKKKTDAKVMGAPTPNMPLEYAIATTMILQATSLMQQSLQAKMITISEQMELLEKSYSKCSEFINQISVHGYRAEQTCLLLKYCKVLQDAANKMELIDQDSISIVKRMLEQNAIYLLKLQDLLTSQVYFIGVHQDSATQAQLTLPLLRLLGITKLRIAQVNTIIGVIRMTLEGGSSAVVIDKRKLDKIVSTFMDNITKLIDSQSATYNKKMNRYEKSISILYSALNLMHGNCSEYSEALVEIVKNRRLLAVTKKHLRGQWRQDAIQVEEVNMQLIMEEEGKDRKETLEEKGLDGEINDQFIDYKKEMLQGFLDLMSDTVGSDEKEGVSTYERICNELGSGTNNLSTFALELAEGRANLNKEQAFYYLALYQYSISRESLLKIYQTATTEVHRDERRKRALSYIREQFSYFTSPALPKQFRKVEDELTGSSKPLQIIKSNFSIDFLKENLPGQTAYLTIQMSEDMQVMYIGYNQINKERKATYYVSKVQLEPEKRNNLRTLVGAMGTLKSNMQKSPITIESDLGELADLSEKDLLSLIKELEIIFSPVTTAIDQILNPVRNQIDDPINESPTKGPGGKPAPADPKKVDPKAKPAPPPKGKAPVKGQPSELAAYESNLPLTAGGVESLVIFVDRRLESLPFESLSCFNKVPVVSRDFNVHLHMQRLVQAGHKADLHNNQGITKEDVHYIVDAPQIDEVKNKSEAFLKELPTLLPGSQFSGLLTHKTHIASTGEWQKQISTSSLFVYFSMTCLLHQFNSQMIADLSILSNCKAMIICDRMNTYKTLIDRAMLTSKHFALDEQPMQQIALFTLCGVNSIVINNWSITPESSMQQFENMMRSWCSDGMYVGTSGLKKHYRITDPEAQMIYKANMVNYGVPLLRLV